MAEKTAAKPWLPNLLAQVALSTGVGYVAAVLHYVRRHWPHQPHVALGISMGAAAVCYAAEHSRYCAAIILESCYYDIASAFANRLRHGYPPWYQRLSRGVIWVTERRLG